MLNVNLDDIDQETYTKIFLKSADIALSDINIATYSKQWWKNRRKKDEGGLRLTDEGLKFVEETLNLKIYTVPFPPDLDLKPQVLLFLDKFINCPYHLSEDQIIVLSEKKCVELHLFSGDVRKYGLTKAMRRELPKAGKTF
jgi:hypothetical protein